MDTRGLGGELGSEYKGEIVGMIPTELRERYAKYLCGIEFDWTLGGWVTHIKFGVWRQVKFEKGWWGAAPFYWSPSWQLKLRFFWFALDAASEVIDVEQYRRWVRNTRGKTTYRFDPYKEGGLNE